MAEENKPAVKTEEENNTKDQQPAGDPPKKKPKLGLFKKILNPSMIFSKVSDNPLVNEGHLYLRKKDFNSAISLFEEVINEDKTCLDAYVGMGKALSSMEGIENAKKSIAHFNQAIKIDPTKLEVYQDIINVYERLGDKKNAMAERKKQRLAKTLKANPSDSKANNNMGVLQLQQKNVNAAIQSFKTAIKLDRSFTVARSNLASALLFKAQKIKEDEDRAHLLKQGLALINRVLKKKNTAEVNLIKAKILLQMGNVEKAAEHCTTALTLDPELKEALNTKRAIEEKLGNVGEASRAYDNYEKMKQQEKKTRKEKLTSPFD